MLDSESMYFMSGVNDTPVILTQDHLQYLNETIYERTHLVAGFDEVTDGIKLLWVLITNIYIFSMVVGFSFMATGSSSETNAKTVLNYHLLSIVTSLQVSLLIGNHLISDVGGGIFGTPFVTEQVHELNPDTRRHKHFILMNCVRCVVCVLTATI